MDPVSSIAAIEPACKTCTRCKVEQPVTNFCRHKKALDGLNWWCKVCKKASFQTNYAENKEKILKRQSDWYYHNWEEANRKQAERQKAEQAREAARLNWAAYSKRFPQKNDARSRVNVLIKAGKVERGACAACGKPRAQAHHPDYAHPYLIVWLCTRHHGEVHAGRLECPPAIDVSLAAA